MEYQSQEKGSMRGFQDVQWECYSELQWVGEVKPLKTLICSIFSIELMFQSSLQSSLLEGRQRNILRNTTSSFQNSDGNQNSGISGNEFRKKEKEAVIIQDRSEGYYQTENKEKGAKARGGREERKVVPQKTKEG